MHDYHKHSYAKGEEDYLWCRPEMCLGVDRRWWTANSNGGLGAGGCWGGALTRGGMLRFARRRLDALALSELGVVIWNGLSFLLLLLGKARTRRLVVGQGGRLWDRGVRSWGCRAWARGVRSWLVASKRPRGRVQTGGWGSSR